ncbi:hypothetical protein GJ697_20820 [Pseudoduganella sp. FT25W]|uniref:DUF2946 domain-containing protein n=1 Tax=Duganella alba TaxID=2666081 RepID=A0A6L5QMT0_9BURK|nr:hypothetical protein [Duganella alba]MRX10281.1 hypothetical protein [Duganella alba]MRX18568.1 hypothetical protein [Duganella alba]
MTVLLRSFVVWLMLLALPYQGYASAQMLLCVAPATTHAAMAMPSGPHDHAAMMAAQTKQEQGSSSHATMKCSGSACCAAAAPLLALELAAPALPSVSRVIPFYSDFLPAVDLAHPERPPQGYFA